MKLRHVIDRTWLKLQIMLTLFRLKEKWRPLRHFLANINLEQMCARSLCPSVKGNFCRVRRKLGEMKSFSPNSRCACAFKSLQFIIEIQCCKEHFYLSETCVFGLVRVTFFEIIVVLWIDISWFSYHHLTCRQISSIHLKLLIRAINNKKYLQKIPLPMKLIIIIT